MGEKMAADFDQMLLSEETIDRASPDLWPEQIPGVSEFAAVSPLTNNNATPSWVSDFEKADMEMIQEFGTLTATQLLEKVRSIQNLAYQLGLEEAREMTRGKLLNILERPPKRL